MFDDELIDGITDGIVSLDSRVGELERKENPSQSGIGPFEFEVHVDIAGGGDYTSVKAAADYVLANAGPSEYWTIVVHAGSYTETPFALPANAALVGVGNAFIFSPGTSGAFITLAGNCVIREIEMAINVDPTSVDCWGVECSGYALIENCTFYVSRSGGSGSSQTIGVIKTETGDINNCWLRLYVQEASYPGARNIVRFDDANPLQESYLRDCTLGFAIDGSVVDDTSSTVYAQGHPLWVIDCVIQKRSSVQAGYDIEAGAGSTIYTSGTLYVKNTGTVVNLDTAVGAIGTVTSVALTVPSILSVAGSPITTAGTLAVTLATQVANRVFAGPATGADAAPTFRALVAADIPSLPASIIGSGVLGTAFGGTGISNATGSLTFNGATSITGGGTLALGGFTFTVPATGTVVLGGGTGAAGRVALWSDASTLTSDADLTFNAFNTLISGGRAGFGGVTAITEITGGFGASSDAILEIGSANVTVSDQHAAHLVLSTRQNNFPDDLIGAIAFANRQSPYTADLRLAGIAAYTAADADEGYLTISTAPAGGGLLEALRVTQNRALWVGKTSGGLIGAGSVDIAGVLSVDDNTILTTLTATGAVDFDSTLDVAGSTTVVALTATGNVLAIGGAGVGIVNAAVDSALSAVVLFHVRKDQNNVMDAVFENRDSGTAAQTRFQLRNGSSSLDGLTVACLGTGFTTNGVFVGDGAYIEASSNLSGGLTLLARNTGGDIRLATGGFAAANLRQIILSTGEIGIGTATPGALVDIMHATAPVLRLSRNDTTVTLSESLGKVEFYGNDTQLTTQNIFGNVEVQAQAAITTDAAFGKMLLRTTGPGTATSPVERLALGLVKTPLTDATANNLFEVTLNAGQMAGGTVIWTIIASNGTDQQSYSGIVTYAVVNKAGAYTKQITHNTANDSKAVSSGTLTATWDILDGTNKVTIRVTPTGSLAETTYQILYSVHSNSPQTIVVP